MPSILATHPRNEVTQTIKKTMGSRSKHQFVPTEFVVPSEFATANFTLRKLSIEDVEKDFDNLIYLTFDVTNREIAKQLNIQFQTTLVIYKNNKEVYRSLGELTKDKIYKAIKELEEKITSLKEAIK